MNPVTGEMVVSVDGRDYLLRFDWEALAKVSAAHGDNPNLFVPEIVAEVASIGMRKNHPEMTPERLMELSPPLVPFVQSVQKALQWAYFGTEEPPEDSGQKKSPTKGGWLRRLKPQRGTA